MRTNDRSVHKITNGTTNTSPVFALLLERERSNETSRWNIGIQIRRTLPRIRFYDQTVDTPFSYVYRIPATVSRVETFTNSILLSLVYMCAVKSNEKYSKRKKRKKQNQKQSMKSFCCAVLLLLVNKNHKLSVLVEETFTVIHQ